MSSSPWLSGSYPSSPGHGRWRSAASPGSVEDAWEPGARTHRLSLWARLAFRAVDRNRRSDGSPCEGGCVSVLRDPLSGRISALAET
jgi:hypothetical protein